MGLIGQCFEFRDGVPSLEQVEQLIVTLTDEPVEREGILDASPSDLEEARRVREPSRNVLLRTNHVTFRTAGDKRRGRRYVDLAVALDGSQMFAGGNHLRLFEAISAALIKLGGIPYRKPMGRN